MIDKATTIVLVHGAFADHHAFHAVTPLIAEQGYRVVTPDLPGHGKDHTPPGSLSLEDYVEAVRQVVRSEGEVILVGHSMAGMVISEVAERERDRVRVLVYVAAYLPQDAQSLHQLAAMDADSLVGTNMDFAPDYSTATIQKSAVVEALCADVPTALQTVILERQRPEPLKPFQGVVSLTRAKFGSVRKAYLRTAADRAATPSLQDRMLAGYPDIPVLSLPTSHLPFLARPAEFASTLVALIDVAR